MEKLFVLGHPVGHSKSPAMHNAAYKALDLPWVYGFADCPHDDQARRMLVEGDWLGLNVTMPYKKIAYEFADWRSEAAIAASGANVLVACEDGVRADNTDGAGCVAYLRRCGVSFEGARAVVCGTGPTSIAIAHEAARAGAQRVTMLGREAARARQALVDYRERCAAHGIAPAVPLHASSYADAPEEVAHADVIMDATPLGMKKGDPAPFDIALLRRGQVVFDVVYGHGETALVAAAAAAGCASYDGSGMLVAQAVLTVRDLVQWLDVPVDFNSADLFSIMSQAAGFAAV